MWNPRETETTGTDPKTPNRDTPVSEPAPARDVQAAPGNPGSVARIGSSIRIKGELTGKEDLLVEGRVEGKIDLKDNAVTVGPNARLRAEVSAKAVVVKGEVNGDVSANDRIELTETSKVEGDVNAPRVVIADGARFKGSVNTYGDRETTAQKKTAQESTKGKKPTADKEVVATPAAAKPPAHAGVAP